jgi:uracil-DNA glycosylase
LTKYIRKVGKTKTKKHMDQVYWTKRVPSFGDPHPKLLVIGLAPAANGGNRTGRYLQGTAQAIGL